MTSIKDSFIVFYLKEKVNPERIQIIMNPKLILCCINPSSDKEHINNEILEQIFSVYGKVIDVYIFAHSVKIKAFIKYENPESVNTAIKALNNQKLSFGRIKTYVANKTEIIRKPSTEAEPRKLSDTQVNFKHPKISETNSYPNFNVNPHYSEFEDFDHNQYNELKTNEISPLHTEVNKNQKGKLCTMETQESYNLNVTDEPQGRQDRLPKGVNGFLNRTFEEINPINPFENQKSKVLIIQKINISILRPKFLSNLFGCFGNIVQLLINKHSGYALVEFQNIDQSEYAFKNLNNLKFFDEQLKIRFSIYEKLSNKDSACENGDIVFYQNDSKTFRYTADSSIRVNEPSSLLHVTGISDAITAPILFSIVSKICEPKKIVQLKKNSKGNNMFLVQFENLEESLEVLSILHNKQINDKFLKISFSHSKID